MAPFPGRALAGPGSPSEVLLDGELWVQLGTGWLPMRRELLLNIAGLVIAGLFVINGLGALIAPKHWVRAWWALSGPLNVESLERRTMNVQVRIAGAGLACFGVFMIRVILS